MGESEADILIAAVDLGVGFFQQNHPKVTRVNMGENCSLVVICENWQIIVNNDLLWLAFDTDVEFVCPELTDFEFLVKDLVDYGSCAAEGCQRGQKKGIILLQRKNIHRRALTMYIFLNYTGQPLPLDVPALIQSKRTFGLSKLQIPIDPLVLPTLLELELVLVFGEHADALVGVGYEGVDLVLVGGDLLAILLVLASVEEDLVVGNW